MDTFIEKMLLQEFIVRAQPIMTTVTIHEHWTMNKPKLWSDLFSADSFLLFYHRLYAFIQKGETYINDLKTGSLISMRGGSQNRQTYTLVKYGCGFQMGCQ